MKHVNEKSKIQYSFWNFFRLVVEIVLGGSEKKKTAFDMDTFFFFFFYFF